MSSPAAMCIFLSSSFSVTRHKVVKVASEAKLVLIYLTRRSFSVSRHKVVKVASVAKLVRIYLTRRTDPV